MIRYAGYDPHEDEFDGELAPLRPLDDEFRLEIDVARAISLRALGWRWAAIGMQLAADIGRRMPYTASGVYNAVYRWKQRREQVTSPR